LTLPIRLRPTLAAVALGAAFVGAACGGGGGSKSTTTSAPSTTVPKPVASIEVRPTQGLVGATFTLIGTGFKPGETVTFTVVFPDPAHAPFTGQPHKTTPDGAVQTTYRATPGNPNGTYTVKATGDMGTTGEGQFTLGPAGGTATTARSTTATTRSTATTRRSTATTR
jgi:hypothetical protein